METCPQRDVHPPQDGTGSDNRTDIALFDLVDAAPVLVYSTAWKPRFVES